MATIEMEVSVRAEIGIAPSEIGREQALTVTLRIEISDDQADLAAASGRIADTLDYGQLRTIVRDAFAERRFDLLEEASAIIRTRILELKHAVSARVSISKHHPWADVPSLTLTR
jgi:dihydroneopterin aldolase